MNEKNSNQRGWLWHLMVLTIGFGAVYVLSTLHDKRTDAYAAFASWLQFIGVLTVAKGIADLRTEVGLPSFWKEFGSELRGAWNRLRGRREGHVAVTISALAVSGTGTATGRAGLTLNAIIEKRLEHIEREIDNLYAT